MSSCTFSARLFTSVRGFWNKDCSVALWIGEKFNIVMNMKNNVGCLIFTGLLMLIGCTQQNSEQEQMSASHPLHDTVVVKDLMVSGDSLHVDKQRVPSCCAEGYFYMEFYTGGGWREFVTDLRHPRVKLAEMVSYFAYGFCCGCVVSIPLLASC